MNALNRLGASGGSNDWAAQQMAEFLSVVTSYSDEAVAELSGIERIAESLEAEVAAIVRDRKVITAIGFSEDRMPVAEILSAAAGDAHHVNVEGLGSCRAATVPLEDMRDSRLLVARFSDEPFSAFEMNLLRGMTRVLSLGLRTLHLVQSERALREQTQAQSREIQERQLLFERLTKIQRSISSNAEPQEVFDAITAGANELIAEDGAIVGLRLIDPDDTRYMIMVSSSGLNIEMIEGTKRMPVGQGAGGRAIVEGKLAIVEEYRAHTDVIPEYADIVQAAMAAPVHENGQVVGSLVVASLQPGRKYSQTEQDILLAFAKHASLALSDAKSVAAQHRTFRDSLSEVTSKAAKEKHSLEEQLRQAQKMEAIGRLAGGVAHDFNNLLMVIQTAATLIKDDLVETGEDTEDVTEILKASDRAARLVRQLLTFSRKEVIQAQLVDVNAMVSDISALLQRTIGAQVDLQVGLSQERCLTEIDPSHMEQILMNLAINARDAMSEGGVLKLNTGIRSIKEARFGGVLGCGDYVSVVFEDTGSGMSEAVMERIFEPFFTTKEQGRGTGLGLATVYGIVTSAGGTIDVRSEVGEGTRFTVLLPLAVGDAPESCGTETWGTETSATNTRKTGAAIMVVDDEVAVRHLVSKMLKRNGFQVIGADSGPEALSLLDESPHRIDLVLSDVAMPDMSGIELARSMKEVDPELPIILMSGYVDDRIADPGITNVAGLIEKPFNEASLLETVNRVVQGLRAPAEMHAWVGN
jgi:signal transduction histidine kinase/ActR/RegA family two-component response regulator